MSKSQQTTSRFQHWKQAFPGKVQVWHKSQKRLTRWRRTCLLSPRFPSLEMRPRFARNSWWNIERTTNQCPRILRIRCYHNSKRRVMNVSSAFLQFQRTSEYFPQYASHSGEVLGVLKQFSCGDEQRHRGCRSDRVGAQEDV